MRFKWGSHSISNGDNNEIAKIQWWKLSYSPETLWPISTKLDTRHPWVKGIHKTVCSNEGSCPFPKGYNNEIGEKMHWWNLKFFFTEPLGQF